MHELKKEIIKLVNEFFSKLDEQLLQAPIITTCYCLLDYINV